MSSNFVDLSNGFLSFVTSLMLSKKESFVSWCPINATHSPKEAKVDLLEASIHVEEVGSVEVAEAVVDLDSSPLRIVDIAVSQVPCT